MKKFTFHLLKNCRIGSLITLFLSAPLMALQLQPDPFAGNNTLYPDAKDWKGSFRTSNYDYPLDIPESKWPKGGPNHARLTTANSKVYVAAVKKFIENDIKGLVNIPMTWSPQQVGWYDMPWGGQGNLLPNGHIDPESGREALMGSYPGQIIKKESYPSSAQPKTEYFQNHSVVYYNDVAGYQLGKIWKNPFQPDLSSAQFPEGSIVVKVETVALTDEQWPVVLDNSSISKIYRPPLDSHGLPDRSQGAKITQTRFLQMAVRVKDSVASPETGWVFIAYAYDSQSKGATVWDRAIPVGATWGNDPKFAVYPDGKNPDPTQQLQETWINDGLPKFITGGLGWGGRLAGPLDVGIRHNVVTVSGKRYGDGNDKNPSFLASSACMSCHSVAQYPFAANLYPSPNMVFPEDGQQFLFFDPGTALWAKWFKNRSGNEAFSSKCRDDIGATDHDMKFESRLGNVATSRKCRDGFIATDYDLMLTFALMRANGSADTDAFIRHPKAGH